MIPLYITYSNALCEYHYYAPVASGNRLRCSLQHFFAVVWFAAKIYRIGILMYGKTNMERAVQMVAILVEIKFGSEWLDFCHKVLCFRLYLALLTVGEHEDIGLIRAK
jgi:hypothetical protein